jgi:hypothetical protein
MLIVEIAERWQVDAVWAGWGKEGGREGRREGGREGGRVSFINSFSPSSSSSITTILSLSHTHRPCE